MEVERCNYCTPDAEDFYKPLDKNGHFCIFDMPHRKILNIDWYGHKTQIDIKYCCMCGRKLV